MTDDRLREEAYRQLQMVAGEIGASPSMRQFDDHPKTSLRPQQIIKMHGKGGWNAAKRAAKLEVHKNATDEEILISLKTLAGRCQHLPSAREINEDASTPSSSLYIHRFGSLQAAYQAAGLTETSKENDIVQIGLLLTQELGYLPGWKDWVAARRQRPDLPSEWQVYRRLGGEEGAWRRFHYQIIEEAASQGILESILQQLSSPASKNATD
jgi:hypothetical protein